MGFDTVGWARNEKVERGRWLDNYYVLIKKEITAAFVPSGNSQQRLLELALPPTHRSLFPHSGTFTPISTLTPYTTNASTFIVTFTTLINTTSTIYWGLGLVGYDNYLTSTFSYNVTVSLLNTTSMSVIAQPQDGTYMLSLKLSYIVTALSPTVSPRMAVLSGCTLHPM